MQNHLSLRLLGVRFAPNSLPGTGKKCWRRALRYLHPPCFLWYCRHTATEWWKSNEIQVEEGRCPSFPTVIILHFIHIRAVPRGTVVGNKEGACVVLSAMGRENLKLAHQSRLVFFLFFSVRQYKAVNHICYLLMRDTFHTSHSQYKQRNHRRCHRHNIEERVLDSVPLLDTNPEAQRQDKPGYSSV